MNTVLACVLLCACAVAALPSPSLHHRELRSPSVRERREDGGWKVGVDKNRNGGTVVRGEVNKQWDVTRDGNVKAEVHGYSERTFGGGRNHGQRDHGVGIRVKGTFRK